MSDEAKPEEKPVEKIEYGLTDFIEEVDTVIGEKTETARRLSNAHNAPMVGLTNLRIDRLNALRFYLRKIDNFQKGKPAPKEEPDEGALAIERAAIGVLFTGSATTLSLAFDLKPSYFRDHAHAKIFEVAYELVRMGKNVDVERLRTFIPSEGHAALDAFIVKPPENEEPAAILPDEPPPPAAAAKFEAAPEPVAEADDDDWNNL